MMQGFVIAIDGPVASGKGTIAPLLAKQLKGFYMNTGAIFRMLALFCKENTVSVTQENLIPVLKQNMFALDDDHVFLNGKDVSKDIYHADISSMASQIAAMPDLHQKVILLEREIAQGKIAQGRIVILEGRNIGTAVFPDAAFKFFLTASVEKRAQRRFEQTKRREEQTTYEEVLADTKIRDSRDVSRSFYPLVSDPENYGYSVVDTSDLTEDQTLGQILTFIKQRGLTQ